MRPSPRQDHTVDAALQSDVPRTLAPRVIHAKVNTMPGDEYNCLLHALRHAPGQILDDAEASNLRVKIGQHVMENLLRE